MRYKLKKIILRVIPLFVSLVLIFGLTFQSPRDTVKLSESSRKCIVTFLKAWDIDVDNEWWNNKNQFRKIGHVVEYFVLGIAMYFVIRIPCISIALCCGISISDQLLKRSLPSRHFDFGDLLYDIVGYVVGTFVMMGIIYIVKKQLKRSKN